MFSNENLVFLKNDNNHFDAKSEFNRYIAILARTRF